MATSAVAFAVCGIALAWAGSTVANGVGTAGWGGWNDSAQQLKEFDRALAPPTSARQDLRINDVRLESPPPDAPAPAISLKFDLLNVSESRITDLLIEVTVVEQIPTPADSARSHTVAGPFTVQGHVTVEPGYTMQFDMLLKNLRHDCDCSATVRVISARVAELGR